MQRKRGELNVTFIASFDDFYGSLALARTSPGRLLIVKTTTSARRERESLKAQI